MKRTLEQDGALKLVVVIGDDDLLMEAKTFFNWKKVSLGRVFALGSKNWNSFIAHLYTNYGISQAQSNNGTQRSPFGMWS